MRETRRACELSDDVYIFHRGRSNDAIVHLAKVLTAGDRTHGISSTGQPWECDANAVLQIATDDEIAAYRREQDRFAVARALSRLGSRIVDEGLPVPPGGAGIVVSFDLADDADLKPWEASLSKRPQRGTSRPHIVAEAEGVEVYVYAPGNSGEFGPDLAEPVGTVTQEFGPMYADVEHRDSVGAFPVVEPRHCPDCYPSGFSPGTYEGPVRDCPVHGERPEPERDGWSVSDGHRPTPPEDAMTHDRHSGGADA